MTIVKKKGLPRKGKPLSVGGSATFYGQIRCSITISAS